MKLYLKILTFIKPYWKAISGAILLTLIYVLFNAISLWVMVDFINEIFSEDIIENRELLEPGLAKKSDTIYDAMKVAIRSVIIQDNKYDTLLAVCLVIFLTFFFKNIAIYFKRVILNYVELQIIVNFRNRLHAKILQLPLSFLDKRHSGELTSIVFNDVNALKTVLQNSFGRMILSPVQIFTNIILMFIISWELSLLTFIVVPVSTFVIVKIGQGMRRRSRRVFRQIANVMATFQEAITSVRIVKAFTSEAREMQKFYETNLDFFKKQFRANRLKFATSPINEVLLVLMLVFLLWYGGNLVYSKSGLSAADFLLFLVYLFTMFQPIKELAGVNNVLQRGFAAAERIFSVLEEKEEVYDKAGAIEIATFSDTIEFKSVKFRYNDESPLVINDVSLNVKKGEMVAFVGHSGSGKTTLVNLLPRFYELSEGQIIVDGHDSRDLTLHSLRGQMSIVTQETILFNDTIRTNIAYGMENVTDTEIIEAAKVANAWEFIEKMENGLDSHIGEKGTRLSGGQKQRISIARAILKNPSILILDEATSALDTESERLVQQAIDKLLESRTVLVIAHRLSTITNANKIVVLNDGQIEAIGKHNELLSTCDTYKKLSQDQFIEV
ncbi:MAG: ABC transporter ATP-binding protein [Calditrichaeota bacterium]|nr:MAG: ABC transporter ATP-binding protein [Calditrichota bacterium]MBL1204519.1 ABC transporter ATP-binding protein [Calditrichota bacterium]NOG44347.1 ABC transporter ATP-binding protein [Calditrichota bacterium]